MLDTDPYLGYHRRMNEDHYGCLFFLVFQRSSEYYWVSMEPDDTEHGFYEGPYHTPREAYYDAVSQE